MTGGGATKISIVTQIRVDKHTYFSPKLRTHPRKTKNLIQRTPARPHTARRNRECTTMT
jgi:hypothetical protein